MREHAQSKAVAQEDELKGCRLLQLDANFRSALHCALPQIALVTTQSAGRVSGSHLQSAGMRAAVLEIIPSAPDERLQSRATSEQIWLTVKCLAPHRRVHRWPRAAPIRAQQDVVAIRRRVVAEAVHGDAADGIGATADALFLDVARNVTDLREAFCNQQTRRRDVNRAL